MESEEFIFEPKPLSDRLQKVPSGMDLMPEKPCTACPSKGSERPVGTTPSLPGTVASASVRLRSGVVNLPAFFRWAAASAGGAITVLAGSTAWETSLAGNAFSSAEDVAARMARSATEEIKVLVMKPPSGLVR